VVCTQRTVCYSFQCGQVFEMFAINFIHSWPRRTSEWQTSRRCVLGLAISSVTTFIFARKEWNWCPRTCYKELWNILTWPSSVVRNRTYSRTHFVPKRPRQLRSDCGGTFWSTSAPRIGFRGIQTSKPWAINCGLFLRTWCAESVTTAWRAWGDPLWRQRKRSPWRRSVRQQ